MTRLIVYGTATVALFAGELQSKLHRRHVGTAQFRASYTEMRGLSTATSQLLPVCCSRYSFVGTRFVSSSVGLALTHLIRFLIHISLSQPHLAFRPEPS